MDPLSIALIGSGVASFGADLSNFFLQKKSYEDQKELIDWQKKQQDIMYEREDTAVQRRTADLAAAGLNPVLAAGSAAGAGPVIKPNTPMQGASLKMDFMQKGLEVANLKQELENRKSTQYLIRNQAQKASNEAFGVSEDNAFKLNTRKAREDMLRSQSAIMGKELQLYDMDKILGVSGDFLGAISKLLPYVLKKIQ